MNINTIKATREFMGILVLMGTFITNTFAQTQTENYIQTREPRTEITTEAGLDAVTADKSKVMRTVAYFDGLGRPTQTIQVQGASTSGRDVVQAFAYDAYGREAVKYLPYVVTSATNGGAYQTDALTPGAGVYQFYKPDANTNPQQTNGVVRTAYPYAVTGFEASPLNRVVEQGASGAAYQLPGTGDANSTGHTVRVVYGTNDQSALSTTPSATNLGSHKVALYTAAIQANGSRVLQRANNTATYDNSQLYLTITRDENWQPADGCIGTTEEYKDKEGHVVLKRTYNKIRDTNGNWTIEMLSTYYVYDDLGNLSFVLPPGTAPDGDFANMTAKLNDYGYQYRYDGRNRVTQKRVPGKGWDFIVYNVLDQVTMTQDANQRNKAPKEWTYTKYDVMGRVIITGIWTDANSSADANLNTPSTTRLIALQENFDTTTSPQWESLDSSTPTGYTNVSVPIKVPAAWNTINYYDNYSNIPGLPAPYTNTTYSNRTTGLLTATKTNVLGTSDMLWTVNYYDEEGRVARTFTQHYLGGHDKLSVYNYDDVRTTYNFNDQPTSVAHYHFRSNAAKTAAIAGLTVSNTYEYDHMGRKLRVYNKLKHESLNSQDKVAISKLTYNGVGQLTKKQLHSIGTYSNFLQNVDYRYNERGWLSSINNSNLTSDGGYTNSDTNDQFGMELDYEAGTASRLQYNGNIAKVKWKQGPAGSTAPDQQIYYYDYDRINRLTSSVSSTVTTKDGLFNEALTYDNMGNIKALGRYDKGSSGRTQIDTLNYTFSGNKLTRVDDGITGTAGFNNGASQADEYTYDGNGNMLKDLNKGITAISYNMLNLPQTVTVNGSTITYTYDAAGKKLSKVFTSGSNITTTEYIGPIQYNNGVIDFIQTEEGRARLSGTVYKYEYDLKDHLGNTRNTLTWDVSDATQLTVKVLQENDYYPFGLTIKSLEPVVPSPKNQYLYNGKELQEETGQYDYGARFYDPGIARWTTVDPLVEKSRRFSSYVYGDDNPTRNIDPDGMETKDIIFIVRGNNGAQDRTMTYRNGNAYWNDTGAKYSGKGANNTIARVLQGYQKIEASNDQVLKNKLHTLENSSLHHFVEESPGANNGTGENSVTPLDKSSGKKTGTMTQYDLSDGEKKYFKYLEHVEGSDLGSITHEMQHQYDYDQGNTKDSGKNNARDPMEIRAVSNENRGRAIEKLPARTTYGGHKIDPLKPRE